MTMLKHLRILRRMPYSVKHVISLVNSPNRQIVNVNACDILKRTFAAGYAGDEDSKHFLRKQRQKLKELSKKLQDEKDMINNTLDRVTDEIGRLSKETKKRLTDVEARRSRTPRQGVYGQATSASPQDATNKNKGRK